MRIENVGGFLPPMMTLRDYPDVVLYGDGRLITQGPQLELYPGPALPGLVMTQLTQHGIEQVLEWAREAGLAGPDRLLGQPIPDAGVTNFTIIYPGGTTHTTSLSPGFGEPVVAPAIAAVQRFEQILTNVRAWLPDDVVGDDAPYAWDRLRVISFPVDPANLPDPSVATIVDWPLARLDSYPLSPFASLAYRCFELTGDDLANVRALFEAANELTAYRSGDVLYQLYLHPLLPDDEACPGF
ncbi:MAG: hypothetical protein QFC55_02220 [Chloroflexota bacterium]|nr:hypothetical protein [Chloroflexota bacterium]